MMFKNLFKSSSDKIQEEVAWKTSVETTLRSHLNSNSKKHSLALKLLERKLGRRLGLLENKFTTLENKIILDLAEQERCAINHVVTEQKVALFSIVLDKLSSLLGKNTINSQQVGVLSGLMSGLKQKDIAKELKVSPARVSIIVKSLKNSMTKKS